MPRDRCNTWPLRRAMGIEGGNAQTSPLIHDRIPEEERSIHPKVYLNCFLSFSIYDDDEGHIQHQHGGSGGHMSGTGSSGTLAGAGLAEVDSSSGSGGGGAGGLLDSFQNE